MWEYHKNNNKKGFKFQYGATNIKRYKSHG